jgi:hypothetical protein
MNRRDLLLGAAGMACSGDYNVAPSKRARTTQPIHQSTRYFSLKTFQRALTGECTHPTCVPTALLSLGELVRVDGFIIDRREGDIILFGLPQSEPKRPLLRTSDWLHAMRSATHRYLDDKRRFEHPGVSIDPQARAVAELMRFNTSDLSADGARGEQAAQAWGRICEMPQNVRATGLQREGLRSAYLLNCLIADELLKSIVDGTIEIEGVVVPSRVLLAEHKAAFERDDRDASMSGFSMSRYWFNAGTVRCGVDGDTCVLLQCDMRLSTEAQMLAGRELVDSSQRDELADQCAASITRLLPRLMMKHPIYVELMNIYRIQTLAVSLVRLNAQRESGLDLTPVLDHWVPPVVEVPSQVPGRWVVRGANLRADRENGYAISRVRIPSCGGVAVNPRVVQEPVRLPKSHSLALARVAALQGSRRPLYWDLPTRFARLPNVREPR